MVQIQFPLISDLCIDCFWNSASFQEMEPEVVEIYLQFATYTEGDFYGLHSDADKENDRVLSVSVQLSKSSDYEGGDLMFRGQNIWSYESVERKQGTVIIFPSYVYHEVTPITKGKRYSLVQWFKGKWEVGIKLY